MPPLEFPESPDEDEDDVPMESEEDSTKKAGHHSRPQINVAKPSRTGRDIHIDKDVPAQGVQSLKPGRIPAELTEKAKAFGLRVNKEAQRLADQLWQISCVRHDRCWPLHKGNAE